MRRDGTRSDTKPDDVVPHAVVHAIASDERLTMFAKHQLLDLVQAAWGAMLAVARRTKDTRAD